MPSYMKEYYGVPEHPEYGRFIELASQGCPRCRRGTLYQKGAWPIGLVMCENTIGCCYVFQYNGEGGWVLDDEGKPGVYDESYKPITFRKAFVDDYNEYLKRVNNRRRF